MRLNRYIANSGVSSRREADEIIKMGLVTVNGKTITEMGYKVELDRPLAKQDFEKIGQGVQLEEGRAMVDDIAIVSEDGKTVGLEIHIGWNRVVRRIFESLDYQVIKLDRTIYAGLDKKDLPRGKWRHLREEEIIRLKHLKKGT
ncbi:MAG: hypothetical protein EBR30_19335 [Cytophagia bacterium]|nr:hypothetical protein [Cytophagia bacterium]